MPTATSTPIAGAPIERCVEILPEFPEGNVPAGTLVIDPPGELSLLIFREQTKRSIPGDIYAASTSPNGKWLSYVYITPPHKLDLIIESADGQKQAQLPFKPSWQVSDWTPWLDNEHVWFPVWHGDNEDPPMLVLNPFTGEQLILLPDYPNFAPFLFNGSSSLILHCGFSNIAYDPSLRFVVYPQFTDDGYSVVLWDRKTEKEIATIPSAASYGHLPLWLPDGNGFVLAALPSRKSPTEWLMVSSDGKIIQLTQFKDLYSKYEFGETASISPDGRYLAFQLDSDLSQRGTSNLIILDLQTSEAINSCISFDYFPIWSPDSRYLAVRNWDNEKQLSSVVVLDFIEGWAVKIYPDNHKGDYRNYHTDPIGWLASDE